MFPSLCIIGRTRLEIKKREIKKIEKRKIEIKKREIKKLENDWA
jgi:hypothetical protein